MKTKCITSAIVFAFFWSCNSNGNSGKHQLSGNNFTECILHKLSKTLDYSKRIEQLQELAIDTLVLLEKEKIMENTYSTFLDIKQNEIKAWMVIENDKGLQNKIILHQEDYVEYVLTITSQFDKNNCKIIRTTKTSDLETNKTTVKTEDIAL